MSEYILLKYNLKNLSLNLNNLAQSYKLEPMFLKRFLIDLFF